MTRMSAGRHRLSGMTPRARPSLADEAIRREPGTRLQDRALRASQFVFELEPTEADMVTIRVILAQVSQKDGVLKAVLTASSFYRMSNKCCLTVPGTFDLLGAFRLDAEHLAAAEPIFGLPGMRHEMRLAARAARHWPPWSASWSRCR